MKSNYYDDDRYDRRSRRGNDDGRWNESDMYNNRNDWDENRSSYYGGRDRMDMDNGRSNNEGSYTYGSNRYERGWSDADRRLSDGRGNDNYRYGSSRNGNRYDDNDEGYNSRSSDYGRYGYSGRGWYGDYEGHSQAAERGWENRRGERNFSSRNRYRDDDDRTIGNGRNRGWFGESDRHSDASERGWDNRR